MNTDRLLPLLLGLSAAVVTPAALAQSHVDTGAAEPAAGARAAAADASEAAPARSSLWMSVRSAFQQRDPAVVPDRRLTAEQRQELREQIRRAGWRGEAETPVAGAHLGGR
jgi:hypothetical protein